MRVAVTGAASGIGAQISKRLRANGHEIVGLDIKNDPEALHQQVTIDLANPASIEKCIESLLGPFDGLVNAAGLPPRGSNAALVLHVNFLGLRQFTNRFLTKLSPGSAIVNIASRAGIGWRNNGAADSKSLMQVSVEDDLAAYCIEHGIDPLRAYALSKEALIVWTKAMTRPLQALKLRMNALSPAAVSTALLNDFEIAMGVENIARNAEKTQRIATVDDVAPVTAFLLSSESGWAKGINFELDGGLGAITDCEALSIADASMTFY